MSVMAGGQPTLKSVARYIDRSLDPAGLRLDAAEEHEELQTEHYSNDLPNQIAALPTTISSSPMRGTEAGVNILLTGATGFLGAYVLHDALMRKVPNHVYAHVRASSVEAGKERIRQTCTAYGLWQEWWLSEGVLEIVLGDLEKPKLGLSDADYKKITEDADLVIHNGARVHWLHPYASLKAANVTSTVESIKICATGKHKRLTFISSTSALDTDYLIQQSEAGHPVMETDDLESSRQGLGTGYGQTKWVSEHVIREACKRGLNAVIIRSGYVMGHPESGVSNTDDFLVRMLKGCIQVGSRPDVKNTINMVPVNRVAQLVNAVSFHGKSGELAHSDAHPRLTFNEYLSVLETYGYSVPLEPYDAWKRKVEQYVEAGHSGKDELALLGLYHMVTGDLPYATKAPNLDDRNAQAALQADAAFVTSSTPPTVTPQAIGAYLSFLIARDFMPTPKTSATPLPTINLGKAQVEALNKVGGRGGSSS